MAHTELNLKNVPAINIIVGKNDSGKTGLLKLLYATVKSLEVHSIKEKKVSFRKELSEKLDSTFMVDKLGDLTQRGSNEKLEVALRIGSKNNANYDEPIEFQFGDRTENTITSGSDSPRVLPEDSLKAVFIPAKEVLTAFKDIRNLREIHHQRGFDDTYLDLIQALDVSTTQGKIATELKKVNQILENLFEGKIEQSRVEGKSFVYKKGKQEFSMHQTAEGIKKIGILTTLIGNRQIGKGTILFMDEPETALHPNAIRKMVEMLIAMSNAGVQIFIATHSYFVIKQMAIHAKKDKLNISCWSLEKEKGKMVTNSFHNLIDGILPANAIVDETLAMYNEDLKLSL